LILSKALLMRDHSLTTAVSLFLLILTLGACQTDTGTGFATGVAGGAVVGAVVGGPVGAAVGGIAGAAVGGILTAEETRRVRTYVATQRSPSIEVAEPVVVGQPAPPRARLSPLPASLGLRTPYRYTVVNERTVLVDPRTHKIVEIVQ
jgi:Protein of unknown function (DUF1236)